MAFISYLIASDADEKARKAEEEAYNKLTSAEKRLKKAKAVKDTTDAEEVTEEAALETMGRHKVKSMRKARGKGSGSISGLYAENGGPFRNTGHFDI